MKKPVPIQGEAPECGLRAIALLDTRPGLDFVDSFFDDGVEYVGEAKHECPGEDVSVSLYRCEGRYVTVAQLAGGDPAAWRRVTLTVWLPEYVDPVMVDLSTGVIYDIEELNVRCRRQFWSDYKNAFTRFHDLPLRAAPVMILDRVLVPIAFDWSAMKPAQIVDALYRPGMVGNKTQPQKAPWMEMPTAAFMPFIDHYGQFKYREWPGKIHSDDELRAAAAVEEVDLAAHPGPSGWDKFGGWAAGPKFEATGRFHPVKHAGKWWLVDPEGNLFWSFGAIRVTPSSAMTPLNGTPHPSWRYGRPMPPRHAFFENLPAEDSPFAKFYKTHDELLVGAYLKRGETEWYDFSSSNLYRKYGDGYYAKFADSCHRRLRSWGMNTIANSSDTAICLDDRTPYAERVECVSRFIEGSRGNWWKFRDPYDPSFTEGVRQALEEHGREAHDPWCIGFFVDNEIVWGDGDTDLARWTLASSEDQPARKVFMKFLADKGVRPENVTVVELRAFTAMITEEYFRKTRETLKSFDPGLAYLGCRFCGAPYKVVEICAKYADVISYNLYTYSLKGWTLPSGIDRPVFLSEFHFGATDRGPFGRSLIECRDQNDRADAIRQFIVDALGNPLIAGIHWHQFSDQATTGRFDGEYFQVGLTDVCDSPYPETIAALRDIGYGLYERRMGKEHDNA